MVIFYLIKWVLLPAMILTLPTLAIIEYMGGRWSEKNEKE